MIAFVLNLVVLPECFTLYPNTRVRIWGCLCHIGLFFSHMGHLFILFVLEMRKVNYVRRISHTKTQKFCNNWLVLCDFDWRRLRMKLVMHSLLISLKASFWNLRYLWCIYWIIINSIFSNFHPVGFHKFDLSPISILLSPCTFVNCLVFFLLALTHTLYPFCVRYFAGGRH